jgi:hypothetical protein
VFTIIGYVLFLAAWIIVAISEVSRGGNDLIICMSGAAVGSLICLISNSILSAFEKR